MKDKRTTAALAAVLLVGAITVGWQMTGAQAQNETGEWVLAVSPTADGGPGAWRLNVTTGYMEWCRPGGGTLACNAGLPDQ